MPAADVLIVEDDLLIRSIVAELLTTSGYAVRVAADGLEAVALAVERPPTLMLLDLQLPYLDAWGVVRELSDQGITVPIIVLSALPSIHQAADELGAIGYCPKPFDIGNLLLAVETALNGLAPDSTPYSRQASCGSTECHQESDCEQPPA